MKKLVSFLLITAMLCAMLPFSAISAFAASNVYTDSQGVKYTLSTDGTYYYVSKNTGLPASVVIPARINGLPVKEIGSWAFYMSTSLTSIVIPNSVTTIGYQAFYKCTSLTSINIPNSVTFIGGDAFNSCKNLTSIEIPNSVTSIGDRAFFNCTILKSIEIPNSVTSIGYDAFYYWTSDQTIYCAAESKPSGWHSNWANGCKARIVWGYNRNPDPVTAFTDSQGVKYTLSGDKTYYYVSGCNKSVTSVAILAEIGGLPVKTIGSYAFQRCTSLMSIDIPNSVTSIGKQAFEYCISLKNISLSKVTSIGDYAFSNCTILKSISLSNVTSIGNNAFYGCPSLTDINVVENNKNYSSANGILFNKDETKLICYPAGKTEIFYNIPDSVTNIGSGAFSGSTNLTSIVISKSVTSIGGSAFSGWTSGQSIYFVAESQPNGWNSDWAYGCNANIVWGFKGDINGDGTVDTVDLVALAQAIADGGEDAALDINADGIVDTIDLVALASAIAG